EVGSSCMLSASSVGMDQCQLALAQSPFQQTVRFWRLLAGINAGDIWFSPLLFPPHEAPAVYGVWEHEVKPNIPQGRGRRLTPGACWGMMPSSAFQHSVLIKPRRSACQSQERP